MTDREGQELHGGPNGEARAAETREDAIAPSEAEAPSAPLIHSLSWSQRVRGIVSEPPPAIVVATEGELRRRTRRELLRYGLAGAAGVALAGVVKLGVSKPRREVILDSILEFDDAVARAMYSSSRLLPTYAKSQVTELRNNYHGSTPDPSYIPDWRLTVKGLRSGKTAVLGVHDLLGRFNIHDQVMRLVCVEGWSAIAWWGGPRFSDLLRAYPPAENARWARLESSVSLDGQGRPELYYVSIDLDTARHPQTMLATHQNGQPLTVEHGAPLRLVAPMKLGLKNIKAITDITYTVEEPPDFWGAHGYSHYDGL
jgi:DMSO/TMAO reductase YedYZ molybdopterin-dependent catalytic subunit